MQSELFRQWLVNQNLKKRPIGDNLSRCRRVELNLRVDLDSEYHRDQCKAVIDRLTYTAADETAGISAPEEINIDGNVKKGLATLKSAVANYVRFRRDA